MGQCNVSKPSDNAYDANDDSHTNMNQALLDGSIRDIAYVEENRNLLACSDDSSIRSFDLSTIVSGDNAFTQQYTGHSKGVNCVS